MMTEELLRTLVNRNLVNDNTLVYTKIRSKGIGGVDIFVKKDVYYFDGMPARAIIDIEGMEPVRFAKAYDIKADGTSTTHKKRGRKSKLDLV
tara:strand:+ start:92 stop:367 length:276 start_codon:yes stop_codon:yes gene_type:complete